MAGISFNDDARDACIAILIAAGMFLISQAAARLSYGHAVDFTMLRWARLHFERFSIHETPLPLE